MSTGRTNALDAIPRASLLTYFRRGRTNKRASRYYQRPPPYRAHYSSRSPLLPRIPEVDPEDTDAVLDEESDIGLWGKNNSLANNQFEIVDFCEDDDEDGRECCTWGFGEALTALCYAILVLVLILNLDVFLSRWGAASGMVDWNQYGTGSHDSGRQMSFCLSKPNREVPGPQMWRLMRPGSSDSECNTQMLTLNAEPEDEWKLRPDDGILFGTDVEIWPHEDAGGKFTDIGKEGEKNKQVDSVMEESSR